MPEQKVKQLKQAFTLFDKDNDSTITPKDLRAFMEALGHECSELELEDMMSECNKAAGTHGNDGGSSHVEFKAFYTAMLPTLKADPAEAQDERTFKVRRLGLVRGGSFGSAARPAHARFTLADVRQRREGFRDSRRDEAEAV